MIVAHISDMHVKRRGFILHHMPHVARPLKRCLAAISALAQPPSCILATGDLTENGTREEYERLREILEPVPIPVYLLPGNHDERRALRAVFPEHRYLRGPASAPIQFTIETADARVVALDSSEPSSVGGYLDAKRLCWLEDRLRERRHTPTLLALHHPPFSTGVTHFDRQRFAGRDELGAILRRHAQVRRIVCGHVHQLLARTFCGITAISAPSTAPTLVLHPRAPGLAWEPGGFLVHRLHAQSAITSDLVRIDSEPVAVVA